MSLWTRLFGKPAPPNLPSSPNVTIDQGAANLWMNSFLTRVQYGHRGEPTLEGLTRTRSKMPLISKLASGHVSKVQASLDAGYWSTIIAVPGIIPSEEYLGKERMCFNLLMVTNDPAHVELLPHVKVRSWLVRYLFEHNATYPYVVVVAGTSRFNYYIGPVHPDADLGHAGLMDEIKRHDGKSTVHARYLGTVL